VLAAEEEGFAVVRRSGGDRAEDFTSRACLQSCPTKFASVRLLTQNVHLAPSTQQAEQAGFTRAEITRRASQFFLKINKR
jgi:hypothetical protein